MLYSGVLYRDCTAFSIMAKVNLSIFSCLLSDFKDYVRQMAADSDFKYAEQFEVRIPNWSFCDFCTLT